MVYTVTITSQGQISIPAKLRRKLGLKKKGQAIISEEKGKLIIEPVKDLLELEGSLSQYAIKGKSIDEIIRLEDEAIEQAFVDDYKRKVRRTEKTSKH